MTSIPNHCKVPHAKPDFVLTDPRTSSTVRFVNPARIRVKQIHVDGCVFTDNVEIRCDYLVNIDETDTSLFVELKGGNPRKALQQLRRSHDLLTGDRNNKVFWIISTTRCPLTSTEVTEEKDRLKKNLQVTLHLKNSPVKCSFAHPEKLL